MKTMTMRRFLRTSIQTPSVLVTRPAGMSLFRRNLSKSTLATVKATLPAVAEVGPDFTKHFYKRMFDAHPELLNVFNVTNNKLGTQQKALFSAIAASATQVLEKGTLPLDMLEGINQKHCALNVQPEHYAVVGEHILGSISDLLTKDQGVLDAWEELYGALAGQCIKREGEIYAEAKGKIGGWVGKRDFIVTKKEARSDNVTEFTFTSKDGEAVAEFTPGQYTTVWFHPESWEYQQPRHYSLISHSAANEYTIAVKKEPLGLVSSHLHDNVTEGDTVNLSPPMGDYHIENALDLWISDKSTPVVLLSAGIGITPTLSMLNQLKNSEERPIVWLHSAKNGHEHPFREYLVGLAASLKTDHFQRRVWYENPSQEDKKGLGNDSLFHFEGRLDLDNVKDMLPLKNASSMYFFCGPKPWMQSVAKQLVDYGVPKESLSFEAFGPSEKILP